MLSKALLSDLDAWRRWLQQNCFLLLPLLRLLLLPRPQTLLPHV
jgi:hypothetical protein